MKQWLASLLYCIQLLFNDVTIFVPAYWSTRPCKRKSITSRHNNTTHQISVCTLTDLYKYATPYPVIFLFASNLPFLRTPLLSLLSQLVGSSSEVADVCFLHESHQMFCPLSRREGEREGGWRSDLSSLMPRLVKKKCSLGMRLKLKQLGYVT